MKRGMVSFAYGTVHLHGKSNKRISFFESLAMSSLRDAVRNTFAPFLWKRRCLVVFFCNAPWAQPTSNTLPRSNSEGLALLRPTIDGISGTSKTVVPNDTLCGTPLCSSRILKVHIQLGRVACCLLQHRLDLSRVRVVVHAWLVSKHKHVVRCHSFLQAAHNLGGCNVSTCRCDVHRGLAPDFVWKNAKL